VRLITRGGQDWTTRFPEVAQALGKLPVATAILDGEIVAATARGRSSFQGLQVALHDPGERHRLQYHIFDVLHLEGQELEEEPLSGRRRVLEALLKRLPRTSSLRIAERFRPRDAHPLVTACKRGLEGVVSKRSDAPYSGGRNRDWIKSKCGRRQEFVVVGFTEPKGSRKGMGALLIAVGDEEGTLRYAGKVGSGFTHSGLAALRKQLNGLTVKRSPLPKPPTDPTLTAVQWVKPVLVAELTFTEWTSDGRLRHPVFVGLREDKAARLVRREDP
jgi:bifunctional non-homologous end joining protein LigD